jgi:antimicrobial peptide system SdpB family protein
MALLYFHAAVGKFASPEWLNGTACYYWLLDPRIGFASEYHDWVLVLLQPGFSAAFLTWGTLALEIALVMLLPMPSRHFLRKPLLVLGVLFHFGNIVFFGLVSFFWAMARPVEQPFGVPHNVARFGALVLKTAQKVIRREQRQVAGDVTSG